MKRFTHLSRTLSLAYPTHRAILTMAAVAAVTGLMIPGDRTPARAMIEAFGTVFLAWAVCRELDPDHPRSALVAGAAAGAVSIVGGATSLAALAGLLFVSRLLVRSIGLRPLLTDIVAVGVFVGVFARSPLTWATGLALAVAVALDTNLPEPAPDHHVWLAGAIGLAVTLTAVLSSAIGGGWTVPGWQTLALAAIGTALGLTVSPEALESTTDAGHRPLHPERLRVAWLTVTAALVLGTLVGGSAHDPRTWPLWVTAIIAAGAIRRGR